MILTVFLGTVKLSPFLKDGMYSTLKTGDPTENKSEFLGFAGHLAADYFINFSNI